MLLPLTRKAKGDLAEMRVAADLLERGHKVAFPYGEDWDYDIILSREDKLERVQVKYTCSDGQAIEIKCRTHSLTNGRIRATKRYTAATIDWIAAYDVTSDRCYYIPAHLLGDGRSLITLRLSPARNRQAAGVRLAGDYMDI